jgi:monofunctional biosynthetic peptidoglycan transglycosylase
VNKAPPPVTRKARPLPGEEYETAKPLPPVEDVVSTLPPASTEPLEAQPEPPAANAAALPPEQPQEPQNTL